MRPEELTQMLRRQPFTPFRIHVTTGQTYEIRHPELVWVRRQCADVALDPDPKTGVIEHTERVSLLHIVRIEDVEAPVGPAKGNGEASA
ncbi:MAG TPA: hypothetical protein VFB80_01985 [Pirellulaceae bacterium]|nr:hypothetical protein [Pirellulaceae bacterium]